VRYKTCAHGLFGHMTKALEQTFTSPVEHQCQTGRDKGDIDDLVEVGIAHAAEYAHAQECTGNPRKGIAKKGRIKSGLPG
jgi:hypothetical protein